MSEPITCPRCTKGIIWTEAFVEENINDAYAKTKTQRGFCFHCGMIFTPKHPVYILELVNPMMGNLKARLETSDTFSGIWALYPLYKEMFSSHTHAFRLRILSKRVDETDSHPVEYSVVFEEEILPKEATEIN